MHKQLKQKDIDFLLSYRKKEKTGRSLPLWARLSALPLALVLAFGVAAGVFALRSIQVKGDIREAQAYLNDASNKQQLALAQKDSKALADVNARLKSISGLKEIYESYPELSKQVLQKVLAAGGGKVTLTRISYESSTGVLEISATAVSNAEAPLYIDRLKATGLFLDNVTYYGFAGDKGSFVFSARCPLKAEAEK